MTGVSVVTVVLFVTVVACVGGVARMRGRCPQRSGQGLCAAVIVSMAVPMIGMVLSILTGTLHASSLR